MDVVYILGSGSLVKNEEIRFSIRSLEENMLDLQNIYIIGEDPEILSGVKIIPASDSSPDKWKNAYHKIILACTIPEISEEFLLMNDDFFMIEPFSGAEFPFYALEGSSGGTEGLNSFHVHCPLRIKKEWYRKMPFDPTSKGHHSPRTFYCNFYKAPPTFCDDFILRAGEGCKDFDLQIKGKPLFSISDTAMIWEPFVVWLMYKFPHRSRFEI
jgi:hypothetical protein